MDIVPKLLSVAVDHRYFTPQVLHCEDGGNTGFPVGILPGSVNIGIAKNRVVQAVEVAIQKEVVLHCMLADAVVTDGVYGVVLPYRDVPGLAVNGASGGSVYHPLDLPLNRGFQEVQCSLYVNIGIELRLTDGSSDIHLGRMVTKYVVPAFRHQLPGFFGPDVQLVKGDPRGNVLRESRGQIVENMNLVAPGEQASAMLEPMKPAPPVIRIFKVNLRENIGYA